MDLLLSIQDVLGAPGASQKSFLEGCMKSLAYALLFHKRIPELHEAAVILGGPLVLHDVLNFNHPSVFTSQLLQPIHVNTCSDSANPLLLL